MLARYPRRYAAEGPPIVTASGVSLGGRRKASALRPRYDFVQIVPDCAAEFVIGQVFGSSLTPISQRLDLQTEKMRRLVLVDKSRHQYLPCGPLVAHSGYYGILPKIIQIGEIGGLIITAD